MWLMPQNSEGQQIKDMGMSIKDPHSKNEE